MTSSGAEVGAEVSAAALVGTAGGESGGVVVAAAPQATKANRDIPIRMDNNPLGRKCKYLSIIVPIVTSLYWSVYFRPAEQKW
jgi:hypothetical protein